MMTIDYENPWSFNNKPFNTEDIKKYEGFVYVIISQITLRGYIGRKYFYSRRRKKGATRRTKAESDWKSYYGSNKVLQDEVKEHGKENYKRIILSLHTTKGDVNYEEVKQQFLQNVLENDKYYNDNINGKWYRKADHIVKGRSLNEDFRF
jgi:hypothetical protein